LIEKSKHMLIKLYIKRKSRNFQEGFLLLMNNSKLMQSKTNQ